MDLEDREQEVREWLDLKLVSGRYSSVIVRQLAYMIEYRSGHAHQIYDEIGALEGVGLARATGTKPPEPLTGILTGLYHKHYSQPASVLRNIVNVVCSDKFEAMTKRIIKDSSIPDDKKINHLIHRVSITGYEQRSRSKKLTGEWIVYKKRNKTNYYLTLGTHAEGNEAILERVLACGDEFPELALGKS